MSIRIIGTGSYVPERILTNQDLEKMVETNDEWIVERTGISQRHIAREDETTCDMAEKAARRALEQANLDPADLDMIIVGTLTGDYKFPTVACLLEGRLQAKKATCFDISAACTGLLTGIEIGVQMMRGNKRYKNVLVIGAEKLSTITDWQDRGTCILFGDAASCVLLHNDGNSNEPDVLVESLLGAIGDHPEILYIPGGGSKMPISHEVIDNRDIYIKMSGSAVFKLAVTAMADACVHVMEQSGISKEQIRWVIPHQANMRIISAIGSRLDVKDEQVYTNIRKYGNTSAASIGICLDELNRSGQLKAGDHILLTAFGGGLVWGSMLLRW